MLRILKFRRRSRRQWNTHLRQQFCVPYFNLFFSLVSVSFASHSSSDLFIYTFWLLYKLRLIILICWFFIKIISSYSRRYIILICRRIIINNRYFEWSWNNIFLYLKKIEQCHSYNIISCTNFGEYDDIVVCNFDIVLVFTQTNYKNLCKTKMTVYT